jgi:hypothetical protein
LAARPSNLLGIHVDVDALHARLQKMTEDELLAFGRQTRGLVYPLSYDGDARPTVSACSIQLGEARAEWRRRENALFAVTSESLHRLALKPAMDTIIK